MRTILCGIVSVATPVSSIATIPPQPRPYRLISLCGTVEGYVLPLTVPSLTLTFVDKWQGTFTLSLVSPDRSRTLIISLGDVDPGGNDYWLDTTAMVGTNDEITGLVSNLVWWLAAENSTTITAVNNDPVLTMTALNEGSLYTFSGTVDATVSGTPVVFSAPSSGTDVDAGLRTVNAFVRIKTGKIANVGIFPAPESEFLASSDLAHTTATFSRPGVWGAAGVDNNAQVVSGLPEAIIDSSTVVTMELSVGSAFVPGNDGGLINVVALVEDWGDEE